MISGMQNPPTAEHDTAADSGNRVIHWPTTSSITISPGSWFSLPAVSRCVAHQPMKNTATVAASSSQKPPMTCSRYAVGKAARLPHVPGAFGKSPM